MTCESCGKQDCDGGCWAEQQRLAAITAKAQRLGLGPNDTWPDDEDEPDEDELGADEPDGVDEPPAR